jgi:hypothetical protein
MTHPHRCQLSIRLADEKSRGDNDHLHKLKVFRQLLPLLSIDKPFTQTSRPEKAAGSL